MTTRLERAVSCITEAVLIRGRGTTAPQRGLSLRLAGDPVRLRGPSRLALSVLLDVETEQGDQGVAGLAGYADEISHADGRMVLAYHWHPVGLSHVTMPHLHLGGRLDSLGLSKAHLPTGVVSLPDVLRFAVVELGVEPLREDWRAVLSVA